MKAIYDFVLTGYGEPITISADDILDPEQFEPDVIPDLLARGLIESL